MKSIVISEYGDPKVLTAREIPTPTPANGDLLVDVSAIGVNYMDIYQRTGRPPYAGHLPVVPGMEGAGTVASLGPDVSEFAVGDRVAWANAPASYAEQVLVPAARAVKVPNAIELTTAAAVMLQGITAHYLSNSTYPIGDGDPVVVHAAAGGVGQLLVQFAKHRGAVVIATTSTPLKGELARAAGADVVSDYANFVDATRATTQGIGAAAVYDGVGASTFEASLSALRPRGHMVLFGAASGPVPPFDLQRLATMGSLYVTRPTMRDYIATRDELTSRCSEIFSAITDASLKVRVGATYPLTQAARAHEDLASRSTTGKLLLITQSS